MLTIKGFLSKSSLKNNLDDTTATFGEISGHCRTFAKDVKEYSLPAYSGMEMLLFSVKDGATKMSVTNAQRDKLLEIGDYLYSLGPVVTAQWRIQDLVANIETRFAGLLSQITCGQLFSDGTNRLPEWLGFRLILSDTSDMLVKFWLRNASFEVQYDEYEIVVVPPVERIDDLFLQAAQVQNLLDTRPIDRTMELIEETKNKKPSTVTAAVPVRWYNPASPGAFLNMTWYAIVYGPKGNTTDLINLAIAEYITVHSNERVDGWKIILPDIFRNTHFVVFPRWDHYAIPNRTSVAGIYSPIAGHEEAYTFVRGYLPEWEAAHISASMQITHHPYRSVGLIFVGGPDNRENLFSISQIVPDYLGVESTHEDFNRQSEHTKQWVTMMGNLLRQAESLTVSLNVDAGMRVVQRDGITYVSQKLDNIEYMVAARFNYASV